MTLDDICQMTTKPEMLNALHACREGHPLNNPTQWWNAYAMASQQPSYIFPSQVLAWLADKATKEAKAKQHNNT